MMNVADMDKPFLTFEQQIDKLINDYDLSIIDRKFAFEALASVSYYDLVNGYKDIFMKDGKYLPDTSIELLFSIHLHNKNIQGVLMKFSTYVENSFKTILSHTIAKNFTEDHCEYLNIQHYKRSTDRQTRENLKYLLSQLHRKCTNCNDNPTKHYRETKNHIPPWILFRNVTFSDVSDLYGHLRIDTKKEIIEHLSIFNQCGLGDEEKLRIVTKALKVVRKFRNQIAHNLQFLSYRGVHVDPETFALFEGTLTHAHESNRATSDIWCFIIAIVTLLNNKYLVQNFLAELNSFLEIMPEPMDAVYFNASGIPSDYQSRIVSCLDALSLSH